MTTRNTQELERQRIEQGQMFLKQMQDMFAQTRQDMDSKFIPKPVLEERFNHLDEVVERIGLAMEKLTGNVFSFHESAPRVFADRAETKQDIADLRTEIEKLKTAREGDMERGWGWRYDDVRGRYKGDMAVERGWRGNAQESSNRTLNWVIGIGSGFMLLAINIIVILALAHH